MEEPERELPGLLAGVRVVDLTGGYGAFGPRLLADLGAEVVRVEDATRSSGRDRAPRSAGGTSLHHLHRNLGKSVLTLDLSSADDATTLEGLLAGADIAFLSDDSTLVSERAELLARHPHLVVTAVSPFGREGPAANWRATELVAQALAGVVYRSGVAELPPVSAPGSYCEDVGATLGAVASLMALWQVRDGGHGQVVDVSSILALAHCTDLSLPLWSLLKMPQPRAGAGLYPLFPCTDGLARIVLPMSPADWRSLIAWLGSPAEWTGPAWEKAMLGPDERDLIMAKLPARFANGTRAEVAADGDAAGLRITPVLTPAEVLSNEHVRARGTFGPVEVDADATTGSATASLFAVQGRRRPPSAPKPAGAAPSWSAGPRPCPDGASPAPSLPLAGVRVLEVGTGIAAPEAGRVLGEWGADVIKIETDKRADFQRRVMGGDMNPAFATPGRNKRALAVDLGNPAGVELVHRLLPHVDVIIENNATGVIDRLGLGWDTVSRINPGIVLVSSQLYGDRGPWATQKGYGPSARAIGGLTWLWAHGRDAPRGVMTIHPDHLAGRLVALGAMAGLLARERTGAGTHVDVAQFEAVATMIGDLLLAESLRPGAAVPTGNTSADHVPSNLYRCADDDTGAETWLALSVTDDETWRALLTIAPTALDRAGWRSEAGRLADRGAIDDAVASWLRDADGAATELALQAAGVPAGRALHPRLQAEHPHFVGRGYPVPVEQPGCGSLLLEGPALTATRMGAPLCGPAPMIGEHTAEICRELLGMDDDEIKRLVEAGAIDA